MTGTIRLIEEKDFDVCELICRKGFKEGGYDYDVVKGFRESLDSDSSRRVFVYEENGKILGLCGMNHVYFSDGAYGIDSCYVDYNHHREGIGTMLITYILDLLRLMDVDLCFLVTRKIEFFKRFGFKVLDTGREDWPVMCIKL